jgi:hypothetical protein
MYAFNGGRPYEIGMYCVNVEINLSQYEKRNDASIATASEMTVSNGNNKSCRRLCDIRYQLSDNQTSPNISCSTSWKIM